MGIIGANWWVLAVPLTAIPACTTEASLSGTPDDELSAQLQPQLASCLGLPEEAVQLVVDDRRRVLLVEWQGPSGFKPATSLAACLQQLNLRSDIPQGPAGN